MSHNGKDLEELYALYIKLIEVIESLEKIGDPGNEDLDGGLIIAKRFARDLLDNLLLSDANFKPYAAVMNELKEIIDQTKNTSFTAEMINAQNAIIGPANNVQKEIVTKLQKLVILIKNKEQQPVIATKRTGPFESKWPKAKKIYTAEEPTGVWHTPEISAEEWDRAEEILKLSKKLQNKNEKEKYEIKIFRTNNLNKLNRSFYFVHHKQPDGKFKDVFVALSIGHDKKQGEGIIGHGASGVVKIGVTRAGESYVYKVSNAEDQAEKDLKALQELQEKLGFISFEGDAGKPKRWIDGRTIQRKRRELQPLIAGMELFNILNEDSKQPHNIVLNDTQRLEIALKILEDLKKNFHDNDFVYSDLKPENTVVRIGKGGQIIDARIIDPGAALKLNPAVVQGTEEDALVAVGVLAGTPNYVRKIDMINKGNILYTKETDILAFMLLIGSVDKLLPEPLDSDTSEYAELMRLCYQGTSENYVGDDEVLPYLLSKDNPAPYSVSQDQSELIKNSATKTWDMERIEEALRERLALLQANENNFMPEVATENDDESGVFMGEVVADEVIGEAQSEEITAIITNLTRMDPIIAEYDDCAFQLTTARLAAKTLITELQETNNTPDFKGFDTTITALLNANTNTIFDREAQHEKLQNILTQINLIEHDLLASYNQAIELSLLIAEKVAILQNYMAENIQLDYDAELQYLINTTEYLKWYARVMGIEEYAEIFAALDNAFITNDYEPKKINLLIAEHVHNDAFKTLFLHITENLAKLKPEHEITSAAIHEATAELPIDKPTAGIKRLDPAFMKTLEQTLADRDKNEDKRRALAKQREEEAEAARLAEYEKIENIYGDDRKKAQEKQHNLMAPWLSLGDQAEYYTQILNKLILDYKNTTKAVANAKESAKKITATFAKQEYYANKKEIIDLVNYFLDSINDANQYNELATTLKETREKQEIIAKNLPIDVSENIQKQQESLIKFLKAIEKFAEAESKVIFEDDLLENWMQGLRTHTAQTHKFLNKQSWFSYGLADQHALNTATELQDQAKNKIKIAAKQLLIRLKQHNSNIKPKTDYQILIQKIIIITKVLLDDNTEADERKMLLQELAQTKPDPKRFDPKIQQYLNDVVAASKAVLELEKHKQKTTLPVHFSATESASKPTPTLWKAVETTCASYPELKIIKNTEKLHVVPKDAPEDMRATKPIISVTKSKTTKKNGDTNYNCELDGSDNSFMIMLQSLKTASNIKELKNYNLGSEQPAEKAKLFVEAFAKVFHSDSNVDCRFHIAFAKDNDSAIHVLRALRDFANKDVAGEHLLKHFGLHSDNNHQLHFIDPPPASQSRVYSFFSNPTPAAVPGMANINHNTFKNHDLSIVNRPRHHHSSS